MEKAIYFGIFLSSIVGADFFGISLNKIGLIPFEFFLLYNAFKTNKNIILINSKKKILLLWYLFLCISSISGILYSNFINEVYTDQIVSKNLKQIIQIFIFYIPILLLLPDRINEKKTIDIIKKGLLLTAHIQIIWAIAQFLLYSLFRFNLNNWFFSEFLENINTKSDVSWALYSNIGGITLLRPTGLNRDAAFLAIIIICSYIFEKKIIWKILGIFVLIISFSRAGQFTLLFYLFYKFLLHKKNIRININKLLYFLAFILLLIFFITIILDSSPQLLNQLNRNFDRILFLITGEGTTRRHVFYPLISLIVLFYLPLYAIFLGIGLNVSGVALNVNRYNFSLFSLNDRQLYSAWAVECDFATVLLGTGIIGFFLYYYFLYYSYRRNDSREVKDLIFCLFLFGFMYNICGLTISQFLFWIIAFAYYKNN